MGTQRQGRSDGAAPVQYQPGGVFNCLCIRLLFERIDALAQALNSLYKAELIDNEARPGYAGPWRDRREVERETAAWVHWYNTRRPHLALGGITPQQAENQHTTTRKEAASTSLHKTQDLTHPLRGIAPVTWRCTRYAALHPLRGATPEQKGCNAYRSGAAHPITRTNAESVGDRRRIRTLTRCCERGQPRPRAD